MNIVDVLTAAGVVVEAQTGWATGGKSPFFPVGIMVHHTGGAATGDAPSLNLCKNGQGGLIGPLCNILVGRSGKAYVIAGLRSNHSGDGAQQVLDRVKQDQPVIGNAVTNKYKDVPGLSGNGNFYGIEVENPGKGEAYPNVQLAALAKICAAICTSHGWTSNRIVHHRQWTIRKVDMSYKGDIPGMVGQLMNGGSLSFAEADEVEEVPFPPEALASSPMEEQNEP